MLLILAVPILLSAVSAVFIWKFGFRIGLLDLPNKRSSHEIPIPRSGGIGIWLSFMLFGILFSRLQIFAILAGIVGLVGLFEDRFNLSSGIRLSLQVIFSIITVSLFSGLPASAIAVTVFLFWIVFVTGTTNFYNFMDGIDGIAGLTGLVGFGFTAIFTFFAAGEPDIAFLSGIISLSCLGFLPLNFPKAKVFMGDAGSLFLGFVFASFVVKLSTTLAAFLCMVMFLCTFFADTMLTLFLRWRKGENITKAHRSHLYQFLSNELKLPHWKVSLMYSLTQLVFGILALFAYSNGMIWQLALFVLFGICFLITYKVVKNMKPKSSLYISTSSSCVMSTSRSK